LSPSGAAFSAQTMRWTVVITLALIVLLAVYTVWPIYDLYRIASAIETRNPVALRQLVNFPSLRASLTKQIVDAYRRLPDRAVDLSHRRQAAGSGLAAMLHSERLRDLLVAPLTESSFGSAWQIWLNSDYSGRTFHATVPVDKPSDQQFRIRLRLANWHWKLSALDLPESTRTQLAQELARLMGDPPK
jgi:hypothetical protein